MPQYVDGSTQRLAQLTGNYDPDGLPHVNFTGAWGCLGVDLGANTIHDDATFVYFGDVVTPGALSNLYNTDMIAFIDHVGPVPGGASRRRIRWMIISSLLSSSTSVAGCM